MLIKFSVENWKSFRDKVTLNMVASREKQHKERLPFIEKYKLHLLPTAAIYGGNGSGKTKLWEAIAFAKRFVIRVTQPESTIPREYFKLDNKCAEQPSKFSFTLVAENTCYEFSFSVTANKVVEEKLVEITGGKEKTLYHREEGKKNISFAKNLQQDQRLEFVAKGTRENQLFLTNSIDQKIENFQPVYDWFKHNLVLISPNSSSFSGLSKFIQEDAPASLPAENILSKFDTGITHLGGKNIPIENLPIPEAIKKSLLEDLSEGEDIFLFEQIILTKKSGALLAKKLIAYHRSMDGQYIPFDFEDESAGTLRMLALLPPLSNICAHKASKVYIIDELDRCLHTLLTRTFLETYLQSCSASTRSQLIFTTHDVLQMDQDLLRRDEIWITERNEQGCSSLFSFAEYKGIRYDKDIQKSYLRGHFGGIPKIILNGTHLKKKK